MKKKIKVEGIEELVDLYNPLVLRDERGKIMCFADYSECYFELLKRLYGTGGRYVDFVLFVRDTWAMSVFDSFRFVATWHSLVDFTNAGFVIVDWINGGKARDKMLEGVVRCSHMVAGTKFNQDMFLSALNKFKLNYQLF